MSPRADGGTMPARGRSSTGRLGPARPGLARRIGMLAWLVVAGAAPAFAGETPAASAPTDAAASYREHCAGCHGGDRFGGSGPALLPGNLERLKPAAARQVIEAGRPATRMPAFGGTLTPAQIDALARWIQAPPARAPAWSAADIAASRIVHVAADRLPATPVHRADPLNLFVVVEAGDHHLTILDGDRFEPLARLATRFALHGGPKFSPDGRFVYLCSRDGWIAKVDLHSLQVVAETRVALNARNLAVSADGRHVLVGNTLPRTLVLLDAADLSLARIYDVVDSEGATSRVSAVYDAAPRSSFVVALRDVPELWEIPYAPDAKPVARGYVHDYRMGEAITEPGRFSPRVTRLDRPLEDFYFDPSYAYVMGASRPTARTPATGQVVNLDVRRRIAELPIAGMPHLGSGITFEQDGRRVMASPNLARGTISVIDMTDWKVVREIDTHGPGFFMRSHENTRYAWFDAMMGARKDTVRVIDKRTGDLVRELTPSPGRTAAHVEFTRDGRYALVSVMEDDGALVVYDATTFAEVRRLPMSRPIGKYNVFNKTRRSEGTSH